jgi:hypothetical protein
MKRRNGAKRSKVKKVQRNLYWPESEDRWYRREAEITGARSTQAFMEQVLRDFRIRKESERSQEASAA